MQISSIIEKVNDFIHSALNRKYNAQIGLISFIRSSTDEKSTFSLYNRNRTINFEIPKTQKEKDRQYFQYRLPQTRIYYSELQDEQFTVKTVGYFDHYILIIQNETAKRKFSFRVNLNSEYKLKSSGQLLLKDKEKGQYIFSVSNSFLIWIYKDNTNYELSAIPGFLQEIYKDELTNHPLNQLACPNKDLLVKIDELWSSIELIGRNRTIIIERLFKNRFSDFVWLQELYLHFGWLDELFTAYSTIEGRDFPALSERDKEILFFCYQRFLYASGVAGWQAPKKLSFAFSGRIKPKMIKEFLKYFLTRPKNKHSQTTNQIQNYWEYIHLPILDYYFKKLVIEDADEFIAFTMLAQEKQFWWVNILIDKLNRVLIWKNTINIFNLLTSLKYIVNLQINENEFTFSKLDTFSNHQELECLINHLHIKYVVHGRFQFTHFLKDQTFNFSIDKHVKILYRENDRKIAIKPILLQPPYKPFNFQTIKITINGFMLEIPLIWRQFKIEFNRIRIKFLLKKSRYQVSLKIDKSIQEIKIDNNEIFSDNELYKKIYLDISKQDSFTNLEFYNKNGARIREFGPHIKQLTIRGYGLNAYGVLMEQYRVARDKSQRTIEVLTNKEQPQFISTSSNELNLRFTGHKCNPVNYFLEESIGVFYKMRYTNPEIFKNNLIIYLQDYKISLKNRIRRICFKRLAFYPKVKLIKNITLNRNDFVFIIGEKCDREVLKYYPCFQLIKLNNKSNLIGIFVDTEDINNLFTERFLTPLQEA